MEDVLQPHGFVQDGEQSREVAGRRSGSRVGHGGSNPEERFENAAIAVRVGWQETADHRHDRTAHVRRGELSL